jgi:hypothetical protein
MIRVLNETGCIHTEPVRGCMYASIDKALQCAELASLAGRQACAVVDSAGVIAAYNCGTCCSGPDGLAPSCPDWIKSLDLRAGHAGAY